MNKAGLTTEMAEVKLTAKERNLVEELRLIAHGLVEVYMLDGQPDRIVKVREGTKL